MVMRRGRVAGATLLLFSGGCAVFPEKPRPIEIEAPQPTPTARTGAGIPTAPSIQSTKPFEDRLIYKETAKGSADLQKPKDDRLKGKTITLAFVNAPAVDVARAVVAELLGEPLAVAAATQATITLSAPLPIPAEEAMTLLEAALAESGLALQRAATGYVLSSLTDAQKQAQAARGGGPGYGVEFAPVAYALPSELAPLIQPFVSERMSVTPDDARSVLILRGPQSDVANAKEAIKTFDSPQLTDRVFGMFRLQNTDPQSMREDLAAIFETRSVGKGRPADWIPIPRLNLLFVTAKTQAAFDDVARWIEKLDQPAGGDAPRLHYYPAQNTSAATLAQQVSAAFGGGASAASSVREASPATTAATTSGSAVDRSFRSAERATASLASSQVPSQSAGGITITTDELNNALIIRATDQQYKEIVQLLERMDVMAPQVLIEATIAEVTLNDSLAFGIRWLYDNAESRVILSDNEAGAVSAVFPGLSYTFVDNDVRASLSALASVTDVTVLSTPSIMVLNNQTANLQVGDQVPIVTQQATSVDGGNAPIVSTLQLKDTGVILEVKPRINASDIVVLEISQEVSDVAPTTTSGIDSPTIQQRRFTSTVAVKNNGTVALGGLIRESHADSSGGVPLLKDLPLLGYAFKSRDVTKRRTELIVFLTPRIVRSEDDARAALAALRGEMQRLGVTLKP